MLQSNIKGVKNPYPLGITATKINILKIPYNAAFTKSILSRIDYAVLRMAASALGYAELPETLPENSLEDEEFLTRVHHALNNIDVEEGFLICPETKRQFPITNGIPDMILKENEVKNFS